MNASTIEDFDILVYDLEDHSFLIFEMQGAKLYLLIFYITIFSLITITGEAIIIFYIQKYSPKERSINTLILVDQVCNPLMYSLN